MFDTIIKKAQQTVTTLKLEDVRKANDLMKLSDRPRRFVMIAFDCQG